MIDLTSFFSDRLRDVAMATNFGAKMARPLLFGTLAFRNGLEYCDADGRINSRCSDDTVKIW